MPYNNNYGGNGNFNGGGRGGYSPRNSAPRTTSYAPKQSTIGIQLANGRAGRFVNVDYWGKNTTIKIGAVQPGSQIDWITTKNAQALQVNLTFSDMNELWDICEEIMDTIKNTGTFTSSGCKVGSKSDSIVEISNGSNLGMSPGIYLVIYKNLDSNNRTNTLEFYPFGHSKIIRGYDHTSGAWKEEPAKLGEFKKFYRTIKEAAKAFTMAQAHTIAHVNYNDKLAAFKAMAAMTAALGVDMQKELDAIIKGGSSGSSSGGYQRGGNGGGYPRGNGGGNYQRQNNYGAPKASAFESQPPAGIPTSIDDPVDITLPMDELSNVDMSQFS